MNIFVIGSRVEIHHYPDWSGTAFLAYDDAEYRIPGEVARILVESLLAAERGTGLEKRRLSCTVCDQPAGTAWVAGTEDSVDHALCPKCHADIAKARDLKNGTTIPAAIKAAFSPDDKK